MRLDPGLVQYHAAERDSDGHVTRAERYELVGAGEPGQLAVWINPPGHESLHPSGYFETYTGEPADYQAHVIQGMN